MVYGPNGIGKSHLVKGLISNYKAEKPDKVAGETTADIVNAIRSKNYDIIKAYENTDVLVVDNGFILNGKVQTSREFLYIANRIINKGGSIIFITDDLAMFLDYSDLSRYINDAEANVIFVDMPYPTAELKEAFIYDYMKKQNLTVPGILIKKFANEEKTISEIKGRLLKIQFQENQNHIS